MKYSRPLRRLDRLFSSTRTPTFTKSGPVAAASRATVELLECRRLLATIQGNVFLDEDADALADFFEGGYEGLTVFLDQNQNRLLDDGEVSTVTDADGNYQFADLEPGDYFVTHQFDQGEAGFLAQTTPGATGRSNLQQNFDIEIVYAGANIGPNQRTLIETAVAKWESVILDDVPDVALGGGNVIDDLRIVVTGAQVDGPGGTLAFAGPNAFRDDSGLQDDFGNPRGLPYSGGITIDLADITTSRAFVETVVHEIGHVLGIGTLWRTFLVNLGSPSVAYIGENGVEELNRLFNSNVSSAPIEPQVEGHWREGSVESPTTGLGSELMTPFISGGFDAPPDSDPFSPLSRLTIGALEDLGWGVTYSGAEPFGPFQIGALPEDFRGELQPPPFTIALAIETADEIFDDANFGVRFNTAPSPFYFNAGPEIVAAGQSVRLLAEIDTNFDSNFDGDADFRDAVRQINFFLETNGEPGLQTLGDVRQGNAIAADTLLFEDANQTDGFEFDLDTTGLAEGEQVVYAAGYDRGSFFTVRSDIISIISGQTAVPERPTDLAVVGINTNNFLVEFVDNATDESGYVLQVSSEAGFDVPEAIDTVYLPAQADTGAYAYVYGLPTDQAAPNSLRYFRVRAFNTFGNTTFAGRPEARSLSTNEVLVDNADEGRVTNEGFTEFRNDAASVALTYLAGETGSATYRPLFSEEQIGEYFVFVRTPNVDAGETLVEIFNGLGTELESRVIDAEGNSEILLGRFTLDEESFVRLSATGNGLATADTVRFLPAG